MISVKLVDGVLAVSELGQRLRETREQKQISLEDLQRTTKIQKRYLKAIEEGRFETLPGLFYARAFVKTYAEAVGIDHEQLFDEFKHELPNPQKEIEDLPSRSERSNRTKGPLPADRSKATSMFPMLIGLAFLIVVAVGIWLVVQRDSDENAVPPEEDTAPVEAEVGELDELPEETNDLRKEEDEAEAPVEEVEEAPIEEEHFNLAFVETQGNTSYYELSGTDRFDVVIRFNGTSYVGVTTADGESHFADNAEEGDELVYDFSGQEGAEFNFGASQFVDFVINGDPFEFALDIPHQKVNITVVNETEE